MQADPSSHPEVRELTQATQALVQLAGTYAVATADQYALAGEDLKRVKGAKDRLEKLRKSMTQPIDAAKKVIMDFFRGPSDQLDRAESQIKGAMITYSNEQERLRQAEQARAEDAARKERLRLEAQANKAATSGKVERAAALEQRAAAVVAPVIERAPPKVVGVSMREVWRFEVTDPALVPREYLVVDESRIRKVVGALKADTKIPGVRVWSEKALASGAA